MANEKWLIDANALESDIRKMFVQYGDGTYPHDREAMIYDEALVDVFAALEEAPTVDAVEVVRCKDCKHWLHMDDGMGDCTNARFHLDGHADPTMKMDDFCACGERREGE